jgi:hypothetical protein
MFGMQGALEGVVLMRLVMDKRFLIFGRLLKSMILFQKGDSPNGAL